MTPAHAVAVSLALLALLLTALSLHISRLRLRHRVSFGDGGHKDLLVATRAHGNALEQTVLYAVLALAALTLPQFPAGLLEGCVIAFTLARVVHAAALFGRWLGLRQAAHAVSTTVHVVLAIGLLWTALP